MAKPQFVDMNHELTADGKKLVAWLDANLNAMESASAAELNTYPGPLKYLWANTRAGMTSERFVRETGKSFALNAWNILEAVEKQEAQAAQVEETAQTTSKIAEQLETVMKELAEARKEIKVLQEAKQPEPKAKKPVKPETTEEVEAESEAE